MSLEVEDLNRRLLRARDAMDRSYAEPLNVRAVAAVAHVSEAHFIRTFRAVFGETPHRYLQRRRVERSMFLLRETDRSVTDICLDVGFTSLGTFSRMFREWLTATALGIGLQPMSALPYLFARLHRGKAAQLAPDTQQGLESLWPRWSRLFDVGANDAQVLAFRLVSAESPTARSDRCRVDEVLQVQ